MPYGSTQRLNAIRTPSKGEVLARSLLSQAVRAPFGAYWITNPAELSSQLQRIVRKLDQEAAVWEAYSTHLSLHFFTAEVNFDLSRDRGKPVLRLSEYSENGRLIQDEFWVRLTDHDWSRCAT